MQESTVKPYLKQILLIVFILVLLGMAWQVLSPFLVPVVWAIILAFSSWPLYQRLRVSLKNRVNLAALLMTLTMAVTIILPIFWLFFTIKFELTIAANMVSERLGHGQIVLPDLIKNLPLVGHEIANWFTLISTQPDKLKASMQTLLSHTDKVAFDILGGIGRNLAKMGFALLTLFFVYRDGEKGLTQIVVVSRYMIGPRVKVYIETAGKATRGAVYGVVFTALAQGFFAGLGYWVAGLSAPIMLAFITVLFALIPFGTPIIWGSIGLWLIITGNLWAGLGLIIWCLIVVSWVDNIVRPFVVSQNVELPFILAFFGVLGGLSAFGLVGLFIGPVILAVAYAVWREWLAASPAGQHLSADQTR